MVPGARRAVVVGNNSVEERNYLETVLQAQGYSVRLAEDGDEVLSLLHDDSAVSFVLLDMQMPIRDGVSTLCELRRRHNGLPVFLMSEGPVPSSVQRVIRDQGAKFLDKPVLPEDLLVAAGKDRPRLARMEPVLRDARMLDSYMGGISGLIGQVGETDVPVLLLGETGVGKEVLARQIHACSSRATRQFVKINCAALPSELIESELFGYERGAFSGAVEQREGLFETAHKGTILLDEIGDMDVRLQAKLLQVLQDGEFRRLGGRELVKVDVRVMAATHQDLRGAIREGRFRQDLFYRLNVITIRIPALRERHAEILPLAEHFLHKYAPLDSAPPSLPPFLREAMLAYDWPGNVRELENAMRRFLVVRNPLMLAEEMRTADAPRRQAAPEVAVMPPREEAPAIPEKASPLVLAEQAKRMAEREAVLNTLRSTHWNRKRAAELLNIDYKALLYKMKKLGIGSERNEPVKPLPVSEGAHSVSVAG